MLYKPNCKIQREEGEIGLKQARRSAEEKRRMMRNRNINHGTGGVRGCRQKLTRPFTRHLTPERQKISGCITKT
jgi:hypothetical protein